MALGDMMLSRTSQSQRGSDRMIPLTWGIENSQVHGIEERTGVFQRRDVPANRRAASSAADRPARLTQGRRRGGPRAGRSHCNGRNGLKIVKAARDRTATTPSAQVSPPWFRDEASRPCLWGLARGPSGQRALGLRPGLCSLLLYSASPGRASHLRRRQALAAGPQVLRGPAGMFAFALGRKRERRTRDGRPASSEPLLSRCPSRRRHPRLGGAETWAHWGRPATPRLPQSHSCDRATPAKGAADFRGPHSVPASTEAVSTPGDRGRSSAAREACTKETELATRQYSWCFLRILCTTVRKRSVSSGFYPSKGLHTGDSGSTLVKFPLTKDKRPSGKVNRKAKWLEIAQKPQPPGR